MFRGAAQSLRRTATRAVIKTVVVVGVVEVTTHLPTQGRSSEFYHYVADQIVTPTLRRVCGPEGEADGVVVGPRIDCRHSRSTTVAHNIAIVMAEYGFSPTVRPSAAEQRVKMESTVFGRTFPNPIGLGAGFDKNGEVITAMHDMGFGFVEIGTVTPKPQPGNPKPRMFRLTEDRAIINRYGFNSKGAEEVEENLKRFRNPPVPQEEETTGWKATVKWLWNTLYPVRHQPGLVGVNIGKNKTSEDPIADYVANIERLGPYADFLVVNVSSPNTPGLRDWQQADSLKVLLTKCLETRDRLPNQPPVLVKLAPDLTDEELQSIAATCFRVEIDGLVVTNTTNQRPTDLISPHLGEIGGLSGAPIKDKSTQVIRRLYELTDGRIPIIGVGGVGTGRDAWEKLKAGASLVEVYSMMVYHGPGCISRIRAELAHLMLDSGTRTLDDVIGSDHQDIFWRRRNESQQQQRRRSSRRVVQAEPVVEPVIEDA